jgi:hypothetical protein
LLHQNIIAKDINDNRAMTIRHKISCPIHIVPQSYRQQSLLLRKRLFEYDFCVAKVSLEHFGFFEGMRGSRVFSVIEDQNVEMRKLCDDEEWCYWQN